MSHGWAGCEPRRRPWMTETGEPLLVCRDPHDLVERFTAWTADTGTSSDDMLTSTLVAMPIPAYPPSGDFGCHPDGRPRRRWAGMRAEMMWHPLFWLPPRSAQAYLLLPPEEAQGDEADGGADEGAFETDDAYMVRVALELSGSLLYHEESGTWMDVLSTVGLDIDNPDDVNRVTEWLDGADDPLIDGIDLRLWIDKPGDPDWAVPAAADMVPDLRVLAMTRQSESILAHLAVLIADLNAGDRSLADTVYWVNINAWMAQRVFDSLGVQEREFWADIQDPTADHEHYAGDTQTLLQGPVREAVHRLRILYGHYVDIAAELLREDGDEEAADLIRVNVSNKRDFGGI